jgi:hypothetical protein
MLLNIIIFLFSIQRCADFVPDSSYSESMAKYLFQYSKTSYCPESDLKGWQCGKSCSNMKNKPDNIVVIGS